MKDYDIVDLTLTLSEDFPCAWPAHMPFKKTNWNWFERIENESDCLRREKYGAYYTEWLIIDEHTGTHFDAPTHYIPHPDSGYKNAGEAGRISGEKVALEKMLGDAVVIDISHLRDKGSAGVSPLFGKEDMLAWEEEHGRLQPSEIAVFYTGWADFYQSGQAGENYFLKPYNKTGGGWPTPDVDCIEYLFESGIWCIATDGASVGAAQGGAPMHIAGLSREMVYIESLCNLDKLPTRGAKFIFLPIKIEKSSGGPGRAIALVPKNEVD